MISSFYLFIFLFWYFLPDIHTLSCVIRKTASCIPDESDRGLKTPVRTRHSRQEPVLGLRASPVTPCIPDESSGDRSTTPARPKRSRQPPKQYEPESGEWVRFESPNK